MRFRTGQTIVENFLSLDADNNSVPFTTFDIIATLNGVEYSGVTINMSLVDAVRGIFSASWSASTIGNYQIYIRNITTNVIFITDPISILADGEFDQTIYIGL